MLLKDRMLFGSDHPLITPDRWMKDFDEAGFEDKVKPLIPQQNATRLRTARPKFLTSVVTPALPTCCRC